MLVHVCLVPAVTVVLAASAVLAHQGGWDETLVVAIPIALFALLLVIANRRATRALAERDAAPAGDEGDDPPDAPPPPGAP
jgi:hypothetical protein